MGIGRRKFLQMFGATIAAIAADPLQSIVLTDDLYINRVLGIAFSKPEGWRFLSMQDFGKLKTCQILKDDEICKELLNAQEPFAVIVKSDLEYPEQIDACITLYAEDFPLLKNEKLVELVPQFESVLQRALKSYSHFGDAKELLISNCESVEYFANFQFETNKISFPARNRCLITSRDRQLFTFNMFDYPANGISAQNEYDRFVESLRYV